jgi:SLT domain-containing protein
MSDDDEYDRHARAQRVRAAAQQMLNDEDDDSNAAAVDVVSAQVEFLTEAIRSLEEQNEKKDHDLRLSAQLGQMLMEKNEDLANRVSAPLFFI